MPWSTLGDVIDEDEADVPAVFLVVAAGVAMRYPLGRQRHCEILSELQTCRSAV
jgi:Na+/melibiose symporter-like transporter